VDDVGCGAGEGFTVNLPVPAGSGDELYLSLVEHVVVPLARAFAPQLVLISAGYDAHRDDPLAGCTVTEAGFAAMTAAVRQVASELAAPVGVALEGGYALGPLARSVAATLEVLADGGAPTAPAGVSRLALDARARLARWWPALA
jgi:acetoin utilization deacetylase AcuC-like enzyme